MPEPQRHGQSRQTLAHALRVVHCLYEALRRYDAEQPVFLVQHGDGVLGIVLDARQRPSRLH